MLSMLAEIKKNAILRINENTPRVVQCINELSEEQLWQKPNENSNSMGNLVLHMCGNITQYVISSIGGKKDERVRDEEFDTTGGYNHIELIKKLENTMQESCKIIEAMTEEEAMRVRMVQGFEFSGIGNVIHAVEHYSYHTGQIAFYTKLLKNKDLKFYGDMDLNVKNEG